MKLIQNTFLWLLCILAVAATPAERQVHRVSIAERSDGNGFVIRVHMDTKVTLRDLLVGEVDANSARVELKGTTLARSVDRGDVAGPILGYELTEVDGSVVVDIKLDPSRPVSILSYPDRNSSDALIALSWAPRKPRERATLAKASRTEIKTVAPRAIEGGSPNVRYASMPGASREVIGQQWRLDCVVIDAGHGGKDPGASANGIREKDVNLAVAKKLGQYVEDRLGLKVIYTRTDDRFVSLHERGRIANDQCGKLFVSIHVNSARSRSAKGTEIYFLGLHKTQAAHDVMERENSVVRLEDNPDQYVDLNSDQAIMATLAQSVYLHESELLAGLVHAQFKDRAQRPARGVKQAGFLVLWKASMPAILVELGFLTNKEEAAYLKTSNGHDLLASAVFRAIRGYRDVYERGFDWQTPVGD